jgi:hypothetical protein
MDLNFHQTSPALPADEILAREVLNQTRAWRACLALDFTIGALCGKDSLAPASGPASAIFQPSPLDIPGDAHAAARVDQLLCVHRFTQQAKAQVQLPDIPVLHASLITLCVFIEI